MNRTVAISGAFARGRHAYLVLVLVAGCFSGSDDGAAGGSAQGGSGGASAGTGTVCNRASSADAPSADRAAPPEPAGSGAGLAVVPVGGASGGTDECVQAGAGAGTGGVAGTSPVGGVGGSTGGTGGGCGDCGDFDCCGGQCVNFGNDVLNCGACGNVCPGPQAYCDQGVCGAPPCASTADEFVPMVPPPPPPDGGTAGAGGVGGTAGTSGGIGGSGGSGGTGGGTGACCGVEQCRADQICCDVPGPISSGPACVTPVNGTCPVGCTTCRCAAPDTAIATPDGERAIADLRVGDLVYSVDNGAMRAVPVLLINRTPVEHHTVMRVTLATGATLRMSAGHPTADGGTFADLAAGASLDGTQVMSVETVPYAHPYTYDILPDSSSGTYVAGGVLIGSTLR